METADDCSLIWPSHIWHKLFQVIQCWVPLQELLVKGNGEVELHYSEIVDGQTTDDPDEVEQVKVLKSLQATLTDDQCSNIWKNTDLHIFSYLQANANQHKQNM